MRAAYVCSLVIAGNLLLSGGSAHAAQCDPLDLICRAKAAGQGLIDQATSLGQKATDTYDRITGPDAPQINPEQRQHDIDNFTQQQIDDGTPLRAVPGYQNSTQFKEQLAREQEQQRQVQQRAKEQAQKDALEAEAQRNFNQLTPDQQKAYINQQQAELEATKRKVQEQINQTQPQDTICPPFCSPPPGPALKPKDDTSGFPIPPIGPDSKHPGGASVIDPEGTLASVGSSHAGSVDQGPLPRSGLPPGAAKAITSEDIPAAWGIAAGAATGVGSPAISTTLTGPIAPKSGLPPSWTVAAATAEGRGSVGATVGITSEGVETDITAQRSNGPPSTDAADLEQDQQAQYEAEQQHQAEYQATQQRLAQDASAQQQASEEQQLQAQYEGERRQQAEYIAEQQQVAQQQVYEQAQREVQQQAAYEAAIEAQREAAFEAALEAQREAAFAAQLEATRQAQQAQLNQQRRQEDAAALLNFGLTVFSEALRAGGQRTGGGVGRRPGCITSASATVLCDR